MIFLKSTKSNFLSLLFKAAEIPQLRNIKISNLLKSDTLVYARSASQRGAYVILRQVSKKMLHNQDMDKMFYR